MKLKWFPRSHCRCGFLSQPVCIVLFQNLQSLVLGLELPVCLYVELRKWEKRNDWTVQAPEEQDYVDKARASLKEGAGPGLRLG